MTITINGEKKEIHAEANLMELLDNFSLPAERIAIELNREVVRKKDWAAIKVKANDRIEIVHFVGGG